MMLLVLVFFSFAHLGAEGNFYNELKQARHKNTQYKSYDSHEVFDLEVKQFLDQLEVLPLIEEPHFSWFQKAQRKFILTTYPIPLFRSLFGGLIVLTEERAPGIYAMINKMADKLNMPMPIIFLAGNKQFFNACAISFSQSSGIIILGQDLFKELTDEQAQAIIAHELSHIRENHVPKKLISSLALTISTGLAINGLQYISTEQRLGALGAITAILIPILSNQILSSWISRVFEKQADFGAAQLVDPQDLAQALMVFKTKSEQYPHDYDYLNKLIASSKVSQQMLAKLKSDVKWSFYRRKFADWLMHSFMFATHPSCDARIAYLTQLSKKA